MAESNFNKQRRALINSVMADSTHGKHIYLLGSAEFGPTNEPILVSSTVGLYNKFGRQGSLIDAFHAVKYCNENSLVYLVKTTGEHANAYLNVNIDNGEIIQDGFILTSSESNELFNDIEILVDIDAITFTFPSELGLNPIRYVYADYQNIEDLCKAINKSTKDRKSYVYAYYSVDPSTRVDNAFYGCNPSVMYMYGGQCGLGYSKNLLYNCLDQTYEMLESHDIDIIIPVDAFMDDIYPDDADNQAHGYNMAYYQSTKDYLTEDFSGRKLSFMDQLINFCVKQLNFGMVTNGIIGYNSSYKVWSKYLSEADDIAKMYKACFKYNLECCSNPFYSFLISVVGGDVEYNKGVIVDNGYFAYAALCASTFIASGTTNVPISDSLSLHHEFSEKTLKELAATGIVTFRHSPFYNIPVVFDGITAFTENESLALYCNVRMIQMCMSYVNKLFQFYVGQNVVELIEEEIITSDLREILTKLVNLGVITSYEYTIVPSYIKGEIKVYLSLMTCYMVKAIQLCSTINVEFDEEV